MSSRSFVFGLVALTACADDGAATGGGASETTAATTGATGATTASSEPTPTSGESGESSGSSSGDPGFDPPTPACGNGYLEGEEECDDGNRDDGDGCGAACQIPCGLELELLELAPTAQSTITGVAVSPLPDGGFVVTGRVREITLDQEGTQTAGPLMGLMLAYEADGALRWQAQVGAAMGDLSLAGGAADANGDVLLIGTIDAADGEDVWIGKRSGVDGEEVWTRTADGALVDSDDRGAAITTTAAGDVLALGVIYDVAKDSDVWLQKLAGADGATLWTTTWSGAMSGGYSIDTAAAVVIGKNDNIHVLAREYVDNATTEVTLLTFPEDGGDPLWTATPQAGGGAHKHAPGPLAVGSDGEVMLGVTRLGNVSRFDLHRISASGGPPLWSLADADFITGGDDWSLTGIGVVPDGSIVLGGSWHDEVDQADDGWYEVWSARVNPDGGKLCQVSHRAESPDLVPPSVFAASFAVTADGAALATGERYENEESSVWTGRFRRL